MNADKLKPCPFCGRPVGYVTSIYGYRVVCDGCDIQGPRSSNSYAEARELWNQRTIDHAPELMIAKDRPTPTTDAVACNVGDSTWVKADFARTLERMCAELAEACELHKRWYNSRVGAL